MTMESFGRHGTNRMVGDLNRRSAADYTELRNRGREVEDEFGSVETNKEGRFGRMFELDSELTSHPSPTYQLRELGLTFTEDDNLPSGDATTTPAGITFLGQFIDHDITLDTASKFTSPANPASISNSRTPGLDLDCIYGGGPDASPHLFEEKDGGGIRLRQGALLDHNGVCRRDLLRLGEGKDNKPGRAVIGDPRNDENIIVSQIQATWIQFHNTFADNNADMSFDEVRSAVTHYYHRVITEEFLPAVVGVEVIQKIASQGRRFYYPYGMVDEQTGFVLSPYMPVEFSVAAYRFGHSQVRNTYALNATETDVPIFDEDNPGRNLSGFQPINPEFLIEWPRFFDFEGSAEKPQKARKLNTKLAKTLLKLPEMIVGKGAEPADRSLAARNLNRGRVFRLPSGEKIADIIGAAPIAIDPDLTSRFAMTESPLWYYVLHEATATTEGDRLGPVGATIVAEVFHGLLDNYRDRTGEGLDYITKASSGNAVQEHTRNNRKVITMQSIVEYAYPDET